MYLHERSLVDDFRGQLFVLLGVNSDPLERLREVETSGTVTWRSWWDGGDTSGPIATRWGIRGWPTIYLIDHEGVIRFRNVRGQALDEAIGALVEAARESTNGSRNAPSPSSPASPAPPSEAGRGDR